MVYAPCMTVLVTGGTGLVGKAVQDLVESSPELERQQWYFAGSKDGDLTCRQSTAALFARVQPTHVLHLAAKVGGLYANFKDNVGFWTQNMAMQVRTTVHMLCLRFALNLLLLRHLPRRTTLTSCAKSTRCKTWCLA